MIQQTLSDPVTFQTRLPVEVLNRMRAESERDMIPLSFLVRKCLLRVYGGDSFGVAESTERTEGVRKIQTADGESK